MDRFGPRADWSAARRRNGVALRCPIRWLKSPTTTRRALEVRFSNPARPSRYSSWSCHVFRSQGGPTRERDQGMQTPMTVTSPTLVWLPGGSGPQQDLPSALLPLFARLTPVGLGADGVAILRQGQTCRVGLGETDDVRSVLGNAALHLVRFPFGRGPFDIPVEQFQRHGASFPRVEC